LGAAQETEPLFFDSERAVPDPHPIASDEVISLVGHAPLRSNDADPVAVLVHHTPRLNCPIDRDAYLEKS
jgi:hypothetical protein